MSARPSDPPAEDLRRELDEVRRGHARSEASIDALRFLARASALLGSTLDQREVLGHLGALLLPTLADACIVLLREDERLVAVRIDDVEPDRARAWRTCLTGLEDPPLGLGATLESRTPTCLEVTEETLAAWARSDEEREVLRRIAPRALLGVPLVVHDRVLGVLALVQNTRGTFTHDELEMACELGRRLAVAVDHARLYALAHEERTRVEQANRAKDDFLAMVSHELRTPLNAIIGWVRLLQVGRLSEERRSQALDTIARNARVQTQLIEDLLDVTRIVSRTLRLTVRSVAILAVVEDAVLALRPSADARGIDLRATLDPDAGSVLGDADRLRQVVVNLLGNAVKFTSRGGHVEVSLDRREDHVEIVVRDDGRGIAAEFMPFVFDRFRQAESAISRGHGGLGLGLAISQHIVELHGGTISASSEGAGKGATFVARIPALDSSSHAEDSLPGTPVPAAELEGVRVLVVEDEPDTRALTTSVLSLCGAIVVTANDAAEALESLVAERFDLVVSDIGLPREDGLSFLRKLRALPAESGGNTPAVALTAYGSAEDRTRALVAGFNVHIAKPVDPGELVMVIANLLGRYTRT